MAGGEQQDEITPFNLEPIGKLVGAAARQGERLLQQAVLLLADPPRQGQGGAGVLAQLLVADHLEQLVSLPLLLQYRANWRGAVMHEALQYLGEQRIQRDFTPDAERQIADDGHGVVVVHINAPLQRMAPL